jgi:hypothetical protein
MTIYEFDYEYEKLEKAYPDIYAKKFRKEIIAGIVKDLDKSWFSALVKRIILNPYTRIDIDEAARSERLAKLQIQKSRDNSQALDFVRTMETNEGYKKAIAEFGATSASEALKNILKRGNNGNV